MSDSILIDDNPMHLKEWREKTIKPKHLYNENINADREFDLYTEWDIVYQLLKTLI